MDRKSGYNVCRLCGESFANDKAWRDHVKICMATSYKHTVTTMSSSSSTQPQCQETGFPSPGWGTKKRRSALENQIVVHIGDNFDQVVERNLQEQSELDNKLGRMKQEEGLQEQSEFDNKLGRMKQEEGLEEQFELNNKLVKVKQEAGLYHALDHETGLQLGGSVNNYKVKPDAMKELGIGNQEKYMCKQCGLEFDEFRGLEEHESIHYMKKWMEEEEGEDDESKAKKNSKKAFKCEICDKNFASKQSLGRHNKVHIKRLDLDQLPPDY